VTLTELSEVREPKFLPRKIRLVMGVDLGQSQDPTAICVIEHCEGVIDQGSDYERHTGLTEALGLQKKGERWRVVHMERLPLGTKYGDVVRHVAGRLAAPQLQADPSKNQSAAELVIDSGGVGRGVAEMFIDAGLDPMCAQTTGGMETNWARKNTWNVPKHELVTLLDARINHDRFPLTFSKQLAEGEAFKQEIADFKRSVGGAGRMKYEARQGKHDDMIIAVALVVWWLSRPKNPPAQFSTYGY
jgi:hypothetical protein